ncbi:signal transduction histidine kinase, nitrogen specific, NtrB [Gluconacetobacter diazotrophicus PA1 5]|uniref:histidine kinase n=2 Tax=Gluconacetobacter diazotrophicus TaxID=33996 RepID=A9HLT3_GLUDA|nr:ATP-binding protein [Gluconacetobacter diazotrophicus]ACI50282.1 signal transduction histidine kinase, nitrogen specific, NtrB [Gluconacetobacter diazotrophicus PA1 5]MBB2154772.1 PAS domain-containing protein [Gluconacetobacter diazotrophicus]TWB08396.1 two-component system nitrogen regulation sensor histidine kinase GlnL [Gluconacetobacter diazotrophicus]CAP56209.1 putative histidine kinase, nitrogen regulation protein ntrB [Gluconacetobacter diazotrophicus PA1 5]
MAAGMALDMPQPDGAALLDAMSMPVVLVGPGNHIRYINSAAEPFFGASRQQLMHRDLAEILAADHPIFLLVEQVRRDGVTTAEHELTLDGPRLHRTGITVQGTQLPDEPDSVLLTFHDSSAARQLDRQLTFRSAARSVSGMAAILAHEVKNPLSGIRGAAQLLESSVAEGDRELAVLIRDEADRIRDLVERMEMFSDKPLERRPVNIHRVLERVRMLAEQGFAGNIRIVEDYDPSLPPVWGNRDQLVQVLLNLVKNAAEAIASDGQGGEITLGTSYRHGVRLAVPGMEHRVELPLVVSVRDTGPGIPDSIRPHLFEPFLTTKTSGSGLGLALAGKIIDDHGGVIEIDSRPGRTEVRLHLPMVAEGRTLP